MGETAPDRATAEDWLGYKDYAQALWQRIQVEFDGLRAPAPDTRRPPTGDPLVIGVYGEWGAGKTRLLELVYDLVDAEAARVLAQRALDPGAYDKELAITLPVWFHPWKYEHETALAVPLLMHVGDALNSYLKEGLTGIERAIAELEDESERASQLVEVAKKTASVIHKVASSKITQMIVGVAAGTIGSEAVTWLGETAAKVSGARDEDDKNAPSKTGPGSSTYPRWSADGSFYYNVHRHLRELTRIRPEAVDKLGLPSLRHGVRLNFVVFVDDLDRCLPEKAVEVLEVIKTLLNVECFAFVAALDDEVIERGVMHRYKDYRFQGAKQEMPITGFEYLEKIVHLPFRLPQLTRRQAAEFVRQLENRLLRDAPSLPRLWLERVVFTTPEGSDEEHFEPTPMVTLLLDSFETYVPRKLRRAVEALHHLQRLLAQRGIALASPGGMTSVGDSDDRPDPRVLLACTMLQLFAPDLFRFVRRRPGIWRQWLWGYLREDQSERPVFDWQKPYDDRSLKLEVSDTLLYRWVASGAEASKRAQAPSTENPLEYRADKMDFRVKLALAEMSQATRFTAEQLRLPWINLVCELRDAQRHAFDPMRLGAALTYAMKWQTAGQVQPLESYLQLFSSSSDVWQLAVTPVQTDNSQVAAEAAPAQRTVRDVSISLMIDIISSEDIGTRRSLIERLELQPGDALPSAAWHAFAQAVKDGSLSGEAAFDALEMLAPHLLERDFSVVADAHPWANLDRWKTAIDNPNASLDNVMLAARSLANMIRAGLGNEKPFNLIPLRLRIAKAVVDLLESSTLPGSYRAEAGDLLAVLGDPRFEFFAPLMLPRRRRSQNQSGDEPVPGFVRIQAAAFVLGTDTDSATPRSVWIRKPFFIARTLTTVDQWRAFINGKGYESSQFWDKEGWDWRSGNWEHTSGFQKAESPERPPEQRSRPWQWEQQSRWGNRPVVGISWFEARAYARWLDHELSTQIEAAKLRPWKVGLPTDDQWELALRTGGRENAHSAKAFLIDSALPTNVGQSFIGRPTAVGSFPEDTNGLYDLAGNVWEWQNTRSDATIDPDTGLRLPVREHESLAPAPGASHKLISIRGASFADGAPTVVIYPQSHRPDDGSPRIGLRVVLSQD